MGSRILTRVNDHIKLRVSEDYIDLEEELKKNADYFFGIDEECKIHDVEIDGKKLYEFGEKERMVKAKISYYDQDAIDYMIETLQPLSEKEMSEKEVTFTVKSKKGWMFKNYDFDIIDKRSSSEWY